jgi:sodium transport system permease protein
VSPLPRSLIARFAPLLLKELRDVVRDRRAAFFAFVFPIIIYPFLFLLLAKLRGLDTADGHVVRVGVRGEYADFLRRYGNSKDLEIALNVPLDPALLEREDFDVLIDFQAPAAGVPAAARILYDGALPLSREGRRHMVDLLERYRDRLIAARFESRGAELGERGTIVWEAEDITPEKARALDLLARCLPAILVLLFFTGGAFAALDLVAGEKERGTLETLFVHPVPPAWITAAKFVVVLACALAAVLLNLLGMMVARWTCPLPGVLSQLEMPGLATLAVVFAALVPLGVLISGVLLGISCMARSFREAQTLLVPVLLLGLAPAFLAALPNVNLNLLTAWIPVGSVSLAVRDAVRGELDWLGFSFAVVSTGVYAGAVLRWSTGLLGREDVLWGAAVAPAPLSGPRMRARRATVFAAAMLLVVYIGGSALQSPHGPVGATAGLALTLWGLVLAPAAAYASFFRISLPEAWALKWPGWRPTAGALVCAPAMALLILGYMTIQDQAMPLPEGFERHFSALADLHALHPFVAFVLFAISPAVCEELLWRGTVQGELERDGRPLRTIVVIAVFFGLFHFSVHRLVPTGLLGAFLAYLRWRTGSIVPSMAFHAAYNALLLFVLGPLLVELGPMGEVLTHPLTLLAALAWLVLALRRVHARAGPGRS